MSRSFIGAATSPRQEGHLWLSDRHLSSVGIGCTKQALWISRSSMYKLGARTILVWSPDAEQRRMSPALAVFFRRNRRGCNLIRRTAFLFRQEHASHQVIAH